MNFLHPLRLFLLLGVGGLAVAYVAVLVRHRRAAAAYADPARLAALSPGVARSRRTRHLSPVLCLAALAALVVAIAQPTRAEAVPRNEGVVVLAIDVSASMQATDISPSRLDAAIAGATDFVEGLPSGLHVGLVAFDADARLLVAPTTDRATVTAAISGLTEGAGTAAGEGIATSLTAVESVLSPDLLASGKDLPASIVLLSDGATTVGRTAQEGAALAADVGVPVTTIAFGTADGTVSLDGETVRVPADPETMQAVAGATGARSFQASSAGELGDVYADISIAVGSTTEQREVTRGVLGVAMAGVLGAVVLAAVRGGRAL
ncbi:VWA domain-containing protein [Aquihabitans sp. G128]|uniref:VWA domain-containing protein n=1 Tax=Aquihabitans sp. G128 TaxID=2849779 RepID=UPI001C212971|nr:VWA domain-containing protein [Aquihabitans sp. G128]QXC61096.1 VWA domain-containing protein [Aquihabitans sp. G128]